METKKYEPREYNASECCVFRKTKEPYGGLSNMASGFPLRVNGVKILTSEALYQACRFPHRPDIQKEILEKKSPMSAKIISKKYKKYTRSDWDNVRIKIMRWCLRVKLAQNFFKFGKLLESTFDKPIVEDSSRDDFWGAIRNKDDKNILKGINALGRLLMELREIYNKERYDYEMFVIQPLNIPDFKLLGEDIETIDERENTILYIKKMMRLEESENLKSSIQKEKQPNELESSVTNVNKSKVEQSTPEQKKSKTRKEKNDSKPNKQPEEKHNKNEYIQGKLI